MVGDLPAKQLSRLDIGLELAGTGTRRPREGRARVQRRSPTRVNLDDAPEPFYLQTGAFELVARIARWLAPGGTAVVTEFGDIAAWPKLSTHLDHPELSTHFGHLQQVARGAEPRGEGRVRDRSARLRSRRSKGLATTRSHFRALRALAAHAGVELPKIGYTPRASRAHRRAASSTSRRIGDLRWDRIEDRLMGLVPHEFKALLAKKPS